jgi:nucleotide-binding universal stress UspA family protein
MSIVKILAPVTGSNRDSIVLATAFALAKPSNAHVEVLFIYPDSREAIPVTEMPMSPTIIQELVDTAEEVKRSASKAAKSALADCAGAAGVKIVAAPCKSDGVSASYRELTGHLPERLGDAANLADLVVFPPISSSDNPEVHDAFVQVLTKSERAVVLCAETAPNIIGANVAIGWDGGRAAAHAVAAAIPILERAEKVELLAIGRVPGGEKQLYGALQFLALHGVHAAERVIDPDSRGVGEALIETAADDGCDLLVAGGYGHSRLRESIFGGVTAHLVSHPKLPMLMVH